MFHKYTYIGKKNRDLILHCILKKNSQCVGTMINNIINKVLPLSTGLNLAHGSQRMTEIYLPLYTAHGCIT